MSSASGRYVQCAQTWSGRRVRLTCSLPIVERGKLWACLLFVPSMGRLWRTNSPHRRRMLCCNPLRPARTASACQRCTCVRRAIKASMKKVAAATVTSCVGHWRAVVLDRQLDGRAESCGAGFGTAQLRPQRHGRRRFGPTSMEAEKRPFAFSTLQGGLE